MNIDSKILFGATFHSCTSTDGMGLCFLLYPRYEVYRGYIVFAFSVIMFVCLSVYIVFAFSVIMFVCLSVCWFVCLSVNFFFCQRFLSNYLT